MRALLDKQEHSGLVCQRQPLRIRSSKAFIVDTDKLNNPDDIKADDLGSWRNDGQHSHWVKVKKNQKDGHIVRVDFCGGKPQNDSSAYCLHRLYFVHHSSTQFKRRIAYLTGM